MAAAFSIVFAPTPVPAATSMVIEATNQVSPGISFMPRSAYKVISVTAAAGASPADIKSAWEAIYGPILSGRKVFVRARLVKTNGLASEWFEKTATAT